MLCNAHSLPLTGHRCCIRSCKTNRHILVCSSRPTDVPVLQEPPQFDVPERQPTPEEARSIAAGAPLTPEQQLAQQMQLPLTQPVRLPPGTAEPRQLMERIKAATTWQELEAAVYQNQALLALQQTQQQQQQKQQQQAVIQLPSPPEAAPPTQQQQAPQQQQQQVQQQQGPAPAQAGRKQRRKQPVPLLNIPSSSSLSTGLTDTPGLSTPATAPGPPASPGSSGSSAAAAGSAASKQQQGPNERGQPSTQQQPHQPQQQARVQQQQWPTQQQQQQQQAGPILNALHVTEAFRRLPALLPQQQRQLKPPERLRVAQLIVFLCQAGLQHAQDLTLDPRGIAHVLSGLHKLGHRDAALLAELQLAALLRVEEFSARHSAMLLAAFASMGQSPDPELMSALQQHITNTLGLFQDHSLSTTIWALAKLQELTPAQHKPSPGIGGSRAQQLQRRSTSLGTSPANSAGGAGDHDIPAGSWAAAATASEGVTAGVRPGVSFRLVQALMWRCDPQMHHWSGRDTAQAAWGLGKLGARPNAVWRQALLAATAPQLTRMNIQDAANLLSALAPLRALPDAAWLDRLCAAATTNMCRAAPMGVSGLLLALLRLKQAQVKAAKVAGKRQRAQQQPPQEQQQQQQQQQEGEEEDVQEGVEPQGLPAELSGQLQRPLVWASADTDDEAATRARSAAATAAAAGGAVAAGGSIGVAVSSLAELRLLKAAVRWVREHPGALQRTQLAGLITALGELLPDSLQGQQEQQQQQVQQVDAASVQAEQVTQVRQQPRHQPAPQQRKHTEGQQLAEALQKEQGNGSARSPQWLKVQRQLTCILCELIPVWERDVDSIARSMGKGRRARYFKLKWVQLLSKCGISDSSDGGSSSSTSG